MNVMNDEGCLLILLYICVYIYNICMYVYIYISVYPYEEVRNEQNIEYFNSISF